MKSLASLKAVGLTGLALLAFAFNSILCRLALKSSSIDPASFSTIRVASGAIVLFVLVGIRERAVRQVSGGRFVDSLPWRDKLLDSRGWLAGLFLFLYMSGFSFAYRSLSTGTGALVLFGSVQVTLVMMAVYRRQRLSVGEYCGIGVAFVGLCVLMLPEWKSPAFLDFALMCVAGAAWGAYTLSGMQGGAPLQKTRDNFFYALPFTVILFILSSGQLNWSMEGVIYALLSGMLASGMGYALWFAALGQLTVAQAGSSQLLVPLIAALGGLLFSGEGISIIFIISCLCVTGGVALVIGSSQRVKKQ